MAKKRILRPTTLKRVYVSAGKIPVEPEPDKTTMDDLVRPANDLADAALESLSQRNLISRADLAIADLEASGPMTSQRIADAAVTAASLGNILNAGAIRADHIQTVVRPDAVRDILAGREPPSSVQIPISAENGDNIIEGSSATRFARGGVLNNPRVDPNMRVVGGTPDYRVPTLIEERDFVNPFAKRAELSELAEEKHMAISTWRMVNQLTVQFRIVSIDGPPTVDRQLEIHARLWKLDIVAQCLRSRECERFPSFRAVLSQRLRELHRTLPVTELEIQMRSISLG